MSLDSSTRVRWGVMGAGGIALRRTIPEGIIPAFNGVLVAVQNRTGVGAIAKQFGVVACASETELLAQSIDAVYIATPVHLHSEPTLRAIAAGKHVLCEKPLGLNVDEAVAMQKSALNAGVKLGVGLMMRFQSQHVEAKRLIEAGSIGRPLFARAQLSCWYPPIAGAWRQDVRLGGGGALVDLGSHCLDLLSYLMGPIASVSCQIGSLVHSYGVEDSALVTLRFANGSMGAIDCFFNVPDEASENRLEVYGSEASILAQGTIGQGMNGLMSLHSRVGGAGYDAQQKRESPTPIRRIAPAPVNMYRAQVESFSDAILRDVPPPVDGKVGVRMQRVLDACYTSAKTGRSVDINVEERE